MKKSGIAVFSLVCSLLYLTPAAGLYAQEQIIQDMEVYRQGNRFIARGQVDQQVLGSSEDAAEVIQMAIRSLPAQGGQILLHRGTYELSRPVVLVSRVWLQGRGRGTLFMVASDNEKGIGILAQGLKGVQISGLAIKPEVRGGSEAGLVIDDCGDCQVRDLLCQGFGKYGIWIRNNSFLCEISGCQLADNDVANIYCENLFRDGRGGKFLPNLISNCIIYGGGHGIECNRSVVLNITGCLVFQVKEYGYYLRDISNSVLISGCRTFQIEKEAVVVERSHEVNISSNIFCWHRGEGIVLDRVSWATITANNIIDTGVRARDGSLKTGIVVRNESKGVQVTGNNIFNWGDQVPMLHGISEDPTCLNNQFVSNNFNYFTGEVIVSKGKNTLVSNNVAEGSYAYENFGKPAYPDFDSTLIERFFLE